MPYIRSPDGVSVEFRRREAVLDSDEVVTPKQGEVISGNRVRDAAELVEERRAAALVVRREPRAQTKPSEAVKAISTSVELKAREGALPGREECTFLAKVVAADLCRLDSPLMRMKGAETLLKAVAADDKRDSDAAKLELDRLRTEKRVVELHERAMLNRVQAERIRAELDGRYAPGGPAGAGGGRTRMNLPVRRGA